MCFEQPFYIFCSPSSSAFTTAITQLSSPSYQVSQINNTPSLCLGTYTRIMAGQSSARRSLASRERREHNAHLMRTLPKEHIAEDGDLWFICDKRIFLVSSETLTQRSSVLGALIRLTSVGYEQETPLIISLPPLRHKVLGVLLRIAHNKPAGEPEGLFKHAPGLSTTDKALWDLESATFVSRVVDTASDCGLLPMLREWGGIDAWMEGLTTTPEKARSTVDWAGYLELLALDVGWLLGHEKLFANALQEVSLRALICDDALTLRGYDELDIDAIDVRQCLLDETQIPGDLVESLINIMINDLRPMIVEGYRTRIDRDLRKFRSGNCLVPASTLSTTTDRGGGSQELITCSQAYRAVYDQRFPDAVIHERLFPTDFAEMPVERVRKIYEKLKQVRKVGCRRQTGYKRTEGYPCLPSCDKDCPGKKYTNHHECFHLARHHPRELKKELAETMSAAQVPCPAWVKRRWIEKTTADPRYFSGMRVRRISDQAKGLIPDYSIWREFVLRNPYRFLWPSDGPLVDMELVASLTR